MRIIVQKFGGTSVATPHARALAIRKVLEAVRQGYTPVVVVSAMGRRPEPYATDTLLGLAPFDGRAWAGGSAARERDMLAACGEVIACVVFVQELREAGCDAVALTGPQAGIRTNCAFGDARITAIDPEPVRACLSQGKVAVVAGFQGAAADGDVATLGRGGSDTTAAALGGALGAQVVEIYSDVEGVMACDPRIVPEARPIDFLTYGEVAEMASHGAKVVHPRAVQTAELNGVPLRIRSTFNDSAGTLVSRGKSGRVITGVTTGAGLARIRVDVSAVPDKSEARVRVFKPLGESGVNVDLINAGDTEVAFSVRQEDASRASAALAATGLACEVRSGCSKVCVIGAGMQDVPGTMARVLEVLHKAGVQVLQTADSEITISLLVDSSQADSAVRTLFREFGLG